MTIVARAIAFAALLAATVGLFDRGVVHPLRCSRAASFGAARLEGGETLIGTLGIRADLASCACVTPPEAIVPIARGAAARVLGDSRAAVAEYQRALAIDRRPEIYFQLGLAQLANRDRPAGIESLTRACAFDPARLSEIADPDARRDVRLRLAARYGPGWVP